MKQSSVVRPISTKYSCNVLHKISNIHVMYYTKTRIFKYSITYYQYDHMARLEDIASMNPWWTKGITFIDEDKDIIQTHKIPFFFRRRVPELKPGNIYIIKGPRRVGKTIWMKKLIERLINEGINSFDIFYYSLDNIKNKNELLNMLLNFISGIHTSTKYILLDEIQSVDGWEKVIQGIVNEGYGTDSVIIVTGSVAHLFKSEMMPGRGTEGNTYIMRNISFNEFCTTLLHDITTYKGVGRINTILGYNFTDIEMQSLLKLLEEKTVSLEEPIDKIYKIMSEVGHYAVPLRKMFEIYIHTGGYPMSINDYLYANSDKPQYRINQDIYEQIYLYAKNDAATLAGMKTSGDPAKAASVMHSILTYVGTRISYSKLARTVDMNTKTFIEYSHRLNESYAFINITAINKELLDTNIHKIYFSDILMHYSVGAFAKGVDPNFYSEKMLNSSSVGIIIEEIIASHLVRVKEHEPMRRYSTYIKFFYGKENQEIDFLFRKNDLSYIAIEVKYKNDVSTKNSIYKVKGINEYILLTKDILESDDDVIMVPAYLFLVLLKKSEHDI